MRAGEFENLRYMQRLITKLKCGFSGGTCARRWLAVVKCVPVLASVPAAVFLAERGSKRHA